MATKREFQESPIYQGEDEQIAYVLDTTPWGGSPSSPSVVLKDGDTDVSSVNLSGSPSVSDDDITTPAVISLTAGRRYRLEIKFTISGNVFEAYGDIIGEE